MGATVAQVRGATFDDAADGLMFPINKDSQTIAQQALDDVAEEFGFDDADEFLEAQYDGKDPVRSQR